MVILDADPGVAFTNSTYTTYESATNVLITVLRSNANTGVVTIGYATTNGTARAGVDYVNANGVLTFSNGITSQSFLIPIMSNSYRSAEGKFVGVQITKVLVEEIARRISSPAAR